MLGISSLTAGTLAALVAVIGAIGAIVAAMVTGLISMLGLIISKEQKVSELRQAWIDALRQETASLIANGDAVLDANFNQRPPAPANALAANEASVRIKLRLNPTEPASISALKILNEHELYFAPPVGPRPAKTLVETENELVAAIQKVLKQEWNRVRSGETIYRVTRAAAIGVTLLSVVALFGAIFAIWLLVFRHAE